jgi:hypothetical protein
LAYLVSMFIVFIGAGCVIIAIRQPKPTEGAGANGLRNGEIQLTVPVPPKTDASTAERVPETAP